MADGGVTGSGLSPALAAYGRAVERARAAAAPPSPAEGSVAPSFAAVLEGTLAGAVAAGREGEAAAVGGIAGRVGPQEVVQAVTAAELSLQAVVAVRDRLIAAYQEILRMPI
jgi:flagellar hook-basal body complex protein FliE